jgi:hypothetical protein
MKNWRQEKMNCIERYEDTGMEPEDVLTTKDLAEIACAMNLLKKYQGIGAVEEFAALKEKERDE